jgi:DNA-binding NarL/FixJ family response regulator
LREGKTAPALALIDLGLPPTPHRPDEGFALIADILAHTPTTRIVVLSGQSDELNARHARALGATEFVAKPADPEYLRSLIRRVLSFRDTSPRSMTG